MYAPPLSRWSDHDELVEAIARLRFATLVTHIDGRYFASPVPMVVRRDGDEVFLETHLARANPHSSIFTGAEAGGAKPSIAIFQGPDAYISPSYYPSKAEHGKVVPTWTYTAVQAEGPVSALSDRKTLLAHLGALTDANEANRERPWSVSDAPADFIDKLTRSIVGLSMHVTRLDGAQKLNQHKPDADRAGAMTHLSGSTRPGEAAVSELMSEVERLRGQL
ncbi:MAG: FMN-binding negative transcriptional regulator [Fulvimarina manganoxydans]|uniref:FMN-binding negative transcriptional regulator n=1 Tax=Fulvimarina manganoxydans TaxID=937218 RepID=UPI0023573521|nr:FMN-binding negative transcriptional regulator [Fulvimarina manganoxydans]MCK5932886.1 FMN-binding negative transcriptional regulator [Fulvimarina manganoxydans]